MKNLGAMFCAALVAFSLVGTSAPASQDVRDSPQFVNMLRANEEITGDHVDPAQLELVASTSFSLPADATGILASFDQATGELVVAPIAAMPDTSGESGCILANTFGGFGYTKSPASCGAYAGFEHPGAVESLTLACINSQYCAVIGYGYDFVAGFNYRYLQLYCQFSTVTVAQGAPGQPVAALGNGICSVFSFGFGGPPGAHLGYVSANGPSAGLINW